MRCVHVSESRMDTDETERLIAARCHQRCGVFGLSLLVVYAAHLAHGVREKGPKGLQDPKVLLPATAGRPYTLSLCESHATTPTKPRELAHAAIYLAGRR